MDFAPPPHSGFAFLAAPRRQSVQVARSSSGGVASPALGGGQVAVLHTYATFTWHVTPAHYS